MKGFKEFKERFMSDVAFATKFKGAQTEKALRRSCRRAFSLKISLDSPFFFFIIPAPIFLGKYQLSGEKIPSQVR